MGGGRGCPGLGEGVAPGTPPDGARTWRGRLTVDKLEPLLPGGRRMTPPPRPHAASTLCAWPSRVAQTRAPGCPFVRTAAEEGSEGPQPEALRCLFFYFFAFGRENSVRFCPIYVSTREQTLVVCVCVFLCWFFFKEIGRRKLLLPFLAFCPRPLRSSDRHPSTFPPHPFCFFLPPPPQFCFATSLHSCL